jgi:hypothetical protein
MGKTGILFLAFVFVTAVTPAMAGEFGWVHSKPADPSGRSGVSCEGSCWSDPVIHYWACPDYTGPQYCVVYCGAHPNDNAPRYGCTKDTNFEPCHEC